MKSFHGNRFVDALIKVIILLLIVHVLILVVGNFTGTMVGLAGLKVFWPHLTAGVPNTLVALVAAAAIYFGVWKYFTKD